VLATLPTKGHAPGVSRKPAVLFGRLSESNRALAGPEGLKIAFQSCRINEKVPAGPSKREEAVGMRDQSATGVALKRLGSIPPGSIHGMMIHALPFVSD